MVPYQSAPGPSASAPVSLAVLRVAVTVFDFGLMRVMAGKQPGLPPPSTQTARSVATSSPQTRHRRRSSKVELLSRRSRHRFAQFRRAEPPREHVRCPDKNRTCHAVWEATMRVRRSACKQGFSEQLGRAARQ